MKETKSSGVRYNGLDSLKFIFSVIIVYFHLLYNNMQSCIGSTETFKELKAMTAGSGRVVECFLIIAGYFIYSAANKNKNTISSFIVSRIIRLWPVFAFYVLCTWLICGYSLENAILDLCFLRCTGVSLSFAGIIWYIPPFFWCSILLFGILRIFQKEKALIFIAILTYLSYCVNINHLNGDLGRETISNWLSLGMLRVLGGLGIGIFVGLCKETIEKRSTQTNEAGWTFWVYSVIEIICIGVLGYHFVIGKLFGNAVCCVILFSLLFYSLISNGGILNKVLSWGPLSNMGKYCYSIYVMQQVSFDILRFSAWKPHQNLCIEYPELAISVSTIFAVFIGIITYHLIEKPSIGLFKQLNSKAAK